MQYRHEHKYILDNMYYDEISSNLSRIPISKLQKFKKSISETTYFLCDENLNVFNDINVRLRRYVTSLSSSILLDSSPAILELKSLEEKNKKMKFNVNTLLATKALVNPIERWEIFPSWLPPVFPLVGTQANRSHWLISNGVRVTIDPEIFFFGFKGRDPFKGHKIGQLGNMKIELKSKSEKALSEVKKNIFRNILYQKIDFYYMQKKIKKIYTCWLEKE
jgi:hypothetical protein